MKTPTLMLVAFAMTATAAAAQQPANNAQSQRAFLRAQLDAAQSRMEFMQAQLADAAQQSAEVTRAAMQRRLNDVVRAFNAKSRFEQATGAKLGFDSIELTSDGEVHAKGNVTLTFDGGVITAGEVFIGNDGTIRIGNSQVTLSRNR
jgi:FKBP-type peptidyl-prolyl cis-trans isomerase